MIFSSQCWPSSVFICQVTVQSHLEASQTGAVYVMPNCTAHLDCILFSQLLSLSFDIFLAICPPPALFLQYHPPSPFTQMWMHILCRASALHVDHSLPHLSSYCDRTVCVSGTACQTWAYGVPSCQHMPGRFSMPVLAHGCLTFVAKTGMLLFTEIKDCSLISSSSCHPLSSCLYWVLYLFSP